MSPKNMATTISGHREAVSLGLIPMREKAGIAHPAVNRTPTISSFEKDLRNHPGSPWPACTPEKYANAAAARIVSRFLAASGIASKMIATAAHEAHAARVSKTPRWRQ